MLELLTAQKQQNSSSAFDNFLYLCYKTQSHPITALPLKEVPWGQSAIQTVENVVQEK